MRKVLLLIWITTLILLMTIGSPLSAQDDTCDTSMFGEIDNLLAQVEEALDNDNITTANVILSGIRTTIAPCIDMTDFAGGGETLTETGATDVMSPVTSNADWTPVIQEFDGVEMVLVPPGCFYVGSATDEQDERPMHQQCFDQPFWIDRYEVTNAQRHTIDSEWLNDNLPLTQINWYDAWDFCELRGGRLPTEAEWEYAARGPNSLKYPWGNTYDGAHVIGYGDATYGSNRPAPVGSREQGISWAGAYDMSGNVSEWTSTLYRDYPYDADDGRELYTTDGSHRVSRGGSFMHNVLFLRGALRTDSNPDFEFYYLGFRCARDYDG